MNVKMIIWLVLGGGALYLVSKSGGLSGIIGSKKGTPIPATAGIAPAYRAILADPTNTANYSNLISAGGGAVQNLANAFSSLSKTFNSNSGASNPTDTLDTSNQDLNIGDGIPLNSPDPVTSWNAPSTDFSGFDGSSFTQDFSIQ